MKVLVISSFFPSSQQDKLPQFLLDQALAFARQYPEDDFTYLATSRAELESHTLKLPSNLRVYRFSYFWPRKYQLLTEFGILSAIKKYPLSILTLPFLFIFEYVAIRKYINKIQPNYVYSHWMLPQGVLAHKLCKHHGIPHVMTSHSSDIEIMFRMGWLGRRLARLVLNDLAAMNVVSAKGLECLESNLSAEEYRAVKRLAILPMGVADSFPQQVAKAREKLPDSQSIELLFMGRLTEKKGIFYLLDAIHILSKEMPDLHLTLAGEGLLFADVSNYIEQHSLAQFVSMTGFVGGQAKVACLAKTDLFILPSITTDSGDREGLPVTLIENMSCGNLCIATYGSGAEELIENGKSGYLIPPKDTEALVVAIRSALQTFNDEQNSIAKSAIEVSDHLRWEILIKGYYDFLFR